MYIREKGFLFAGGIFVLFVSGLFFLKYLTGGNIADKYEPANSKEALLQLIQQEKKAHLEKKAELLVSGFSSNFRSISAGVIAQPPQESSLAKFGIYFSNADILKWDDEQEPVITFLNDSTMAYVVFQKDVVLKNRLAGKIEETHFAWVSVYKKYRGQWKLDCIASTNKP